MGVSWRRAWRWSWKGSGRCDPHEGFLRLLRAVNSLRQRLALAESKDLGPMRLGGSLGPTALAAHGAEPGNEVIGIAVIKAYEFSFELSWKTLKDLLAYEGIDALLPRQVLRQAFATGLLQDGQL